MPNWVVASLIASIYAYIAMPWAVAETAASSQAFRDWALTCPPAEDCVLEQRLFLAGGDVAEPVLRMAFQAIAERATPLVAIRVPLGVLVSPGLSLRVDQGEDQQIPLHHCRPEGCLALFPLEEDWRQALEAGRELQVGFRRLDGQTMTLPVSLLGITAGLRALEERDAAQRR